MKFQLPSLTTIYLNPKYCVAYALIQKAAMLTGMISPALISLFVQRKTIGWLGILECWLEQVHRLTPAILRNSRTSALWLVFLDR